MGKFDHSYNGFSCWNSIGAAWLSEIAPYHNSGDIILQRRFPPPLGQLLGQNLLTWYQSETLDCKGTGSS